MGSFTYAPDGKRGVINDSDGLYEQLRRLTPSGLELIELPFDRVGYPRWSPADDRIALDAVPHAGGGSPSERVDAERNLYTLSGRRSSRGSCWRTSAMPASRRGHPMAGGLRS